VQPGLRGPSGRAARLSVRNARPRGATRKAAHHRSSSRRHAICSGSYTGENGGA
jgi:hypothetical protein